MSYKVYIKQFDNDKVLKLTVTGKTKIKQIKKKLRKNGYKVQHLMKESGLSLLSDHNNLSSLQIFHKSVLICLLLPSDHYSLIPKANIFCHTSVTNNQCKDGIKCKYYSFCLEYKYNQKIYTHMTHVSHTHMTAICRNRGKCYAYQRCLSADNSYNIDDRCHVLSFVHPPKLTYKQHLLHKTFNPFIYCSYMSKTKLFDLITFPNNSEQFRAKQTAQKLQILFANRNNNNSSQNKPTLQRYVTYNTPPKSKQSDSETNFSIDCKPDYIDFLIYEIMNNGYISQLFIEKNIRNKIEINLNRKYPSIIKIVCEKMSHSRHLLYGKPLNYGELLALIVYCDCDFKFDMIQSLLFNSNVHKWRWFIYILDCAIEKLSKYEIGMVNLYSYLQNYNIFKPSQNKPFMFLGTFVDFYVDSDCVQKQCAKNNETGTVIEMFVSNQTQNENISDHRNRRIFVGCCDVSWIDKFSKEKRVAFRPFATFYGYKIVKYKEKCVKILLCHGRQIGENEESVLQLGDDSVKHNHNNLLSVIDDHDQKVHKRTNSTAL